MRLQAFALVLRKLMASLDSVSIAILLGAVLVMAGILSSLLALRFGAPLLLVFLVIGMLAGDSGPGQGRFDDVRTTYLVGSVALALILFDGGLRRRFQSIRAWLRPSGGAGAQSRRAAAGATRPLCLHRGAGDFRRGADRARLGLPRRLSRRHHHRQPADAGA